MLPLNFPSDGTWDYRLRIFKIQRSMKEEQQAFPIEGPFGATPGMTMRQAYKLAALRLIVNQQTVYGQSGVPIYDIDRIAKEAGLIADACINEDLLHI